MTVLWIHLGVTAFVVIVWLATVATGPQRPARKFSNLTAGTLVVAASWPLLLLAAVACVVLSAWNALGQRVRS